MRTSNPITTINYTSRRFLIDTLESLRKAKVISFWFFVHHLPEDDEKKEHDHVYLEPAKIVQTEDIRDNFRELDPEHPDAPLSVQPFRSSKFADAYLYFIHDPDYLASKGMTRKHHYSRSQVETSDPDYLDEQIARIDRSSFDKYSDMRKSIKAGLSFDEYLANHYVPIQQFNVFKSAYLTLLEGMYRTYRNGRVGHENPEPELDLRTWICTSCGEVVGEKDAAIRQGKLCTCRRCLFADREKHPQRILCPNFTIISTEKGYVDMETGKFVDLDDIFEQVSIPDDIINHKTK